MVDASLRAFYDDGSRDHYKGSFTLDRWNQSPIRYRISYDAFDVSSGGDDAGTIELPLSEWKMLFTKGKSANMEGRVMIMTCNSNDTKRGLEKLQLTISTKNGGHRVAKIVFEAFNAANIELCSGSSLVGKKIGQKEQTYGPNDSDVYVL